MWWSMMVSVSLGLGLAISPESLVVLGHGAGLMGHGFLLGIALVLVVHATTIRSYGSQLEALQAASPEPSLLHGAFGRLIPLAIFLCSKVALSVALSTAVLATAGFVFNEVFLYWFPNFAFVGILLAGLVVMNLLSEPLAEKAEVVLILLILTGLSALIVMGLPKAASGPTAPVHPADLMNLRGALTAFTAFIGFDLACYGQRDGREAAAVGKRAMIVSLLLPAVVMGLWVCISALTVSAARLTESTVPHMTVARAIGGETGRILMGGVVLCGAAAVVNGFLLALPRNVAGIASLLLSSPEIQQKARPARCVVLLLGIAITAMLLAGMAGEPVLESCVRAGILFWLIHYVLVLGAILHPGNRSVPASGWNRSPLIAGSNALALAFLVFAIIMLITGDAEVGVLARIMLISAGVSLLCSAWILWILERRRPKS